MKTVLADLGGTNLRLSKDNGQSIEKFKIADHDSFHSVVKKFCPDLEMLYLASAITPLNGVIEDKRFGHDSHWRITLADYPSVKVLNDLEAAAYGLAILPSNQARQLLAPTEPQRHFAYPPKLLIGVGTGVGHAFLFERPGEKPFVQRTHGGHIPAFGVSDEQQEMIVRLRTKQTLGRDLIMENLIGGNGLTAMMEEAGRETAIRLFWEFLGLYANMLVTGIGAYGGLYFCGGVMDELASGNAIDTKTFRSYFIRPMVDVVMEGLSSTPVYYCHDVNLPILGLSVYSKGDV